MKSAVDVEDAQCGWCDVEDTECGLLFSGQWDSMEEYMCYIPRTTYEGTFYRAVFALHMENYQQAQQVGL